MGEIIGKDLGYAHAGISLSGGKLQIAADLDGNALVDLVIDFAEKEIPGDFDKPLLEVVRVAAKAGLAKL